ncbi:MAG: DUF3788 domain-containing protein [Ignavibacteriaceae bacterium]|nr:DUF3788 domain-containing protein [Ignavibacteriaceae bacterium]
MGANIFTDKAVMPDDKLLAEALGVSYKYLTDIKRYVSDNFPCIVEEWKYYGAKYGWTLKTFLKKRNLFFISAYDRYFRVSFVFGDKAVSAAEQSDLPKEIMNELLGSKKYMEGRGIAIEVRKQRDVSIIKKLIEIKVNN